MKAILTIGYYDFLFPDPLTATKALTLLSGALAVKDRTFEGVIEVDDRPPEMGIKVINKPYELRSKDGHPVTAEPKKKRGGRLALPEHKQENLLRLR